MTTSASIHAARARRLFRFAAVCLCAVTASKAQKPASSEQLKSPAGLTEVGVLDGATYRIDVPADWNHKLVVYYHGYAQQPVTFHLAEKLTGQQAPIFERRYAVAQSGYSQPGWALPQAYPETETLRKYFVKKFGQPTETYVAGGSMGGALVMVTLELNPKPYLGGLDLCGAVGPTFESFERRFAMRAAFDRYFPNVMGPLVPVPSDYLATEAVREKIMAALKTNPQGTTEMKALLGLHNDAQLAWDIAYFTFVIGDMQKRAGGNPFDNRNFIYTGADPDKSASDFALNDAVKRYAAQPKAQEYLMRHYYPSGRLERPMMAVHTVNDPLVPAGSLALYNHMVEAAGFGENLVQQYVKHDGHCNITPEEEGRAFDELVEWTHHGPRPVPGAVPVADKKVPPVIVKEQNH